MTSPTQPLRVLTKTTAPGTKEIDLGQLNQQDLENLKERDPFAYHSTPSVRGATVSNEDADPSRLFPGGLPEASSIVSRMSRLSTECHASVLMESILRGNAI
eukprot:CAMPEP_0172537964 /NCGR_PEP_ID=MMETSP1067-20121228/9464_1 /TAXON_ID=265564 ORGANISM="Thalassiosira punctigera, Strain Tpunct2005C2" /NCGR_SAMPLE_ID=MMETSP1067 /ASSEMBLY_ACC=CAM_ASM_000444 /LENGTH=101 /DNA_ID=CAMNT_0013323373 /DNA_START=160 /DNA_END=465 /DNA_ORIENTATION=+